tara:strand:+ start:3806 stop:3967 length:162 start_codon:yes stop_codon:yes gene_type:complete
MKDWTNQQIRDQHRAFVLDHYRSFMDAAKMVAKMTGRDLETVLDVLAEERETS